MPTGSTLYWIGTPRHFLIAAGMAVGHADVSDSHLLLTSAQDYVDGIRAVLDRWSASPFSHTLIIRPGRPGSSLLANRIRAARSAARYHRMATEAEYSEVRVFSGTDTATQAYLYEVKRRSPTTKRVMLEDGGIFYNSQFIGGDVASEGYPRWKLIAGRIAYGPAWAAVKKNGIGEVIDEIHLTAPELARKQWTSLDLVKLPPDHLLRLSDTDLPSVYLSLFDCDAREMATVEAVFILSRSDGLLGDPKGYVETVDALLNAMRRRGLKVALKYHPKEPLPDYMGLRDKTGVVEIPRELPMELLFLVAADSLKFVLGDTSTALLAAPWMLPDCRSVSFVNMVNKLPELIYPNFEGFGVELIDSERDLEEMLISA